MLCKQRRHHCQLLCFAALNSLKPSSFTSNPNPTTRLSHRKINPKSTISIKPLLTGVDSRFSLSSNPPPSSLHDPTTSSIISLLSDSSSRPLGIDTLLINFKNHLTSGIVLRILRCYKLLGRSRTLEFFSWAGFHLEFRFDDTVVEYMADFLGRRKLFDDLKCLLKTVASRRGCVSSRSVAISIRFLGRQGRIMEALALFENMEFEFSCSPDNLVFNNVLYVLCRKDVYGNFIDAAVSIFRRIGKPDKFTYSNILIGLSRFGRLENAMQVFYEMKKAHLNPTRNAANILIKQLCESGGEKEFMKKVKVTSVRRPFVILVPNVEAKFYADAAVDLFWAVLELDLMPSGYAIIALITELCQLEKFEEAVKILEMVDNQKLRCCEESYFIVIVGLCKACRTNEAFGLFEKMLSQGFKPKVAAYNSLIRMLCKLRHVEKAKEYFDVMKKRRCEPNCATYCLLIRAYCSVQDLKAAFALLMEMMDMGWQPRFDTYRLMDDFLRKDGRHDLLLKLERKMDVQLLQAHCKAGRLGAAYEILKLMLAKGFCLPIYAKHAFERAFRKTGKWKIASQILGEIDQLAIQKNN